MFIMPDKTQPFEKRGGWVLNELVMDLGLTLNQAAGIVGNLGFESNGFHSMQEIAPVAGRGGYGWAQWTGPRRRQFEAYASSIGISPSTDEANYGFLVEELKGPYRHTIEQLKKTTTVEAAVFTFGVLYEAPGGTTPDHLPGYQGRLQWANVALKGAKELVHVPMPPPLPPVMPLPAIVLPPAVPLTWWQWLRSWFS